VEIRQRRSEEPEPTVGLEEIAEANAELDGGLPQDILHAASERFAPCTMATGFGVAGCVLIDMVSQANLRIDVFTLDTGLLFPETYELWHRLEARYGVTIRAVRPALTVSRQAAIYGEKLWEREPDRCCQMRKVFPLGKALAGFKAWVTAIRRDETQDRADAEIVEYDGKFGLAKINPLLQWTRSDVWDYARANDVPFNPLHERGYPSLGCIPCTTPIGPNEDERAGRWRGQGKAECGLHTRSTQPRALNQGGL